MDVTSDGGADVESASTGDAAHDGSSEDGSPDGPRRKRRRRRRKKKPQDGEGVRAENAPDAGGGGEAAPPRKGEGFTPGEGFFQPERSRGGGGGGSRERKGGHGAQRSATEEPASNPAWATLAAGLLSHLDDRQVPCKVDGCANTWTWTAREQMQAFGQPPPRRMCAEHMAKLGDLGDREVPCANPGCERTWTWPKSAQLAQVQRGGSAEPPRKVCPECIKEERDLGDREVPCRVDGCARTWTWTRDAQLKHRTWARRHAEEEEARGGPPPPEPGRGGKRRRRRRQRADVHEPPPRMCLPCRDKAAKIVEREVPCKVHGCTRSTVLDRESQLRAWAKLGTLDLEAEGTPARRMCETCREFCRNHPDREVPCGRPGCDKSWTYKTGAQLQDFLAGRRQDPIRLCEECAKGGAVGLVAGAPEGTEVLPCVVPLCDGVWFHREGVTEVTRTAEELPLDRMCDRCRAERGAEPRREQIVASAPEMQAPAAVERDEAPAGQAEAGGGEAGQAEAGQAGAIAGAGAANEAVPANEAIPANEPVPANEEPEG